MSERNGYEHGVPSWIAGAHADPQQAAAFYTELGAPFSVTRVKPA